MAVFVCVTDESYDDRSFVYGGFAAPADIWDVWFDRAWTERVLNGPPPIPWLHMTEVMNTEWQSEHGLTPWQADRRLDCAADVICSTGGLVPVVFAADADKYASIVLQPYSPTPTSKAPLVADYIAYVWFALTQLKWLHDEFGADVERVDFKVEENGPTTRRMAGFHRSLIDGLTYINREELVPLVGTFETVGKRCVAAQAADFLLWHARRARSGRLRRSESRRYHTMTKGANPHRGRFGHRGELREKELRALAELFASHPEALTLPDVP